MSKKKPVAAPTADPAVPPTVFPRTGEIHFHDTHVAIWEEWEDQPGDEREAKEARRQEHFRGVEAAFEKLLGHLRRRGFKVEPDRKVDKLIRRHYWVGRKGHLECHAKVCGRTAEVEFFQNVANVDNPNGGRYCFDKFKKMPRDMRLRCAVEMVALIRAMQALGYTYGPKSDLYEPLARAVIRKAERREQEGLSPLERFNRSWGSPRFARGPDGWPALGPFEAPQHDASGHLLHNGDVRYFRDHQGRLARGVVFTDMNSMWTVTYPDGSWLSKESAWCLFSTDRPDLLPRRVVKETQVSRVSRELGHARSVQARVPGSPAPIARKLPVFLAWMAPILWAGAVTTAATRVTILEGVLARLAAGERGYYILSRKERDAGDAHCTFFRTNAAGYAWHLECAGRFQEAEIKKAPSYYDNEESTLAVPCEAVEALAGAEGCVPNTKANLAVLLRAAGEARGARGQSSVLAERKASRAARKAAASRATEAA